MNRLIARVLGEAASTGTATRSDQKPPRPEPEVPPEVDTPDDESAGSVADQRQREANVELGAQTPLEEVQALWQSGNKYDACKYMLFSNFLYTDFVHLLYGIPEQEGIEMGNILDELAPTYSGPEYELTDTVASAAGIEGSEGPPSGHDEGMDVGGNEGAR